MKECTTIAVDLAKNVYQVTEADERKKPLRRHRLRRHRFLELMAKHEPATVLMEACSRAHHWGRTVRDLGHRPKLLPPGHVEKFVLRDKTDHIDTVALLAAEDHPRVVPVPIKTEHQQTLMSLHRLRSAWMKTRQGRICTVRGLLGEYGVWIPKGARHVFGRVTKALDDPGAPVPHALHPVLRECLDEIRECEARIEIVEQQLRALAEEDEVIQRLMSLPGIGLVTATALRGYIGDFSRFPSGRHLASYLGLTPKESSSGERRRLGRISKKGDRYLRCLVIQGARSALAAGKRVESPDPLRQWALALEARTCFNHAAVGLANKLARIAWAVATRETSYEPRLQAA